MGRLVMGRSPGLVAAVVAVAAWAGACSSPRCGLVACDIRAPACQQRLAEVTACLREAPVEAVPVRVISLEQYLTEVDVSVRSQTTELRFGRLAQGLSLFAFAPAQLTLTDAVAEQAWAAALYDPDKHAITIIDRGEPMDSHWQVALLIHEYVHALQGKRGVADFDGPTDRDLGASAALEGEAVLVEDLAELELFAASADDVKWSEVFGKWQGRSVQRMVQESAPLLVADQHFVYPFGTPLVHHTWKNGGWAAVDALTATPPASSRQVLAGAGAPEPAGGPWTEPMDTEPIPALAPSFELLVVDELGAWMLEIFLDRLEYDLARRGASNVAYHPLDNRALAARLRADRFAVQDDPTATSAVTSWRLRFDGADGAQRLLDWLAPRVPPFLRAWRQDRDVLLVASNREALVASFGPALPWKAPPAPMPMPRLHAGHPVR